MRKLTGVKTVKFYPDKLRRVKYFDEKTGKRFSFLTNNFVVSPIPPQVTVGSSNINVKFAPNGQSQYGGNMLTR